MKSQLYNSLDLQTLHRFALGFDRMLDELHRTSKSSGTVNYPPYNVVQEDRRYTIEVAVAGFDETELSIELTNNELVIKGEKTETKPVDYLHKGIASRNFNLVFAIADVVEVTGASVKNGILTIGLELQLPEPPPTKKIAIAFQK